MNSMTLHHVHGNVQLWSPAASKRAHQRKYVAVSWELPKLPLSWSLNNSSWRETGHRTTTWCVATFCPVCALTDTFKKVVGHRMTKTKNFIASTKPSNQIKDCSCRSSLRQDEVHTTHTYCIHTYSMPLEESSQVSLSIWQLIMTFNGKKIWFLHSLLVPPHHRTG